MLILLAFGPHYDLLVATAVAAGAWWCAAAALVWRWTARR